MVTYTYTHLNTEKWTACTLGFRIKYELDKLPSVELDSNSAILSFDAPLTEREEIELETLMSDPNIGSIPEYTHGYFFHPLGVDDNINASMHRKPMTVSVDNKIGYIFFNELNQIEHQQIRNILANAWIEDNG